MPKGEQVASMEVCLSKYEMSEQTERVQLNRGCGNIRNVPVIGKQSRKSSG
jgi:hypothetical protein